MPDPPHRPPSIDGHSGSPSDDAHRIEGRRYSVRWDFAPTSDAPSRLRSLLRDTLVEWGLTGDDAVEDVLVVVSELVTNSVQHAMTRIDVRVDFDGTTVALTVRDASPALPRLRPREPDDPGTPGLRLTIVDALASRWGTTAEANGKTVWATVLPRRRPPNE